MTTKYAIIRKRCLNYTACLTVIRRQFPYGNMVKKRFGKKIAGGKRLIETLKVIIKLAFLADIGRKLALPARGSGQRLHAGESQLRR